MIHQPLERRGSWRLLPLNLGERLCDLAPLAHLRFEVAVPPTLPSAAMDLCFLQHVLHRHAEIGGARFDGFGFV